MFKLKGSDRPNLPTQYFRNPWKDHLHFSWKWGLFFIFAGSIPRFILVLYANQSGNYQGLSLVFLLLFLLPFLLLNKNGRTRIGFRAISLRWVLPSFIAGIGLAILLYLVANWIWGTGIENWFVYISRSYPVNHEAIATDKMMYFLIFSFISMLFSPLGEECFYRGLVHEFFTDAAGSQNASRIDSLAFALTHLSHFGIIFYMGGWQLLWLPGLLWITGMYAAARLFYFLKQGSGSLWAAVLGHAGFNLGMTWCIFYLIW